MKDNKFNIVGCMIISYLLIGCGGNELGVEDTSSTWTEESHDEVEATPLVIEESEEVSDIVTFEFKDVHGESYIAELIETIPMHQYDYSRLNTENSLYTYTNEAGEVDSSVGIDVSKYQGDIDWEQVKAYGVEFVIIRLGYRGYGEEGTLGLDELYETNITGALDAGLEVGVYFFSQAITKEEAVEEAQFVLENIEKYNITMPVVFDTEIIEKEDARTYGVDGQVFTDACIAFCDEIELAGYDSMIYFNMIWSAFTLDLTQLVVYDKWYADYYEEPQYPYEFKMWQYTESGTVPGIEGNVDLNIIME